MLAKEDLANCLTAQINREQESRQLGLQNTEDNMKYLGRKFNPDKKRKMGWDTANPPGLRTLPTWEEEKDWHAYLVFHAS